MPRPTDSAGDELRPVAFYDSSGRALRAGGLRTLFSAPAIRDTRAGTAVEDCACPPRKVLAVVNIVDQAVATVPATFAGGVSVPAGATRYLAALGHRLGSHIQEARLDTCKEDLIVTLRCSIAPTSGTVSVHILRYAL